MAQELSLGNQGVIDDGRGNSRTVSTLLELWLVAVIIFVGWQGIQYEGIYAALSEWQFRHLGQAMPILTFVGLVLLLGLPSVWLFRGARKKYRSSLTVDQSRVATIRLASRIQFVLTSLCFSLAVLAVVTAAYALIIPGREGRPISIPLDGKSRPVLRDGAAQITGQILRDSTAKFDRNLLFFRRDTLFSPIVQPGTRPTLLTFFVELQDAPKAQAAGVVVVKGVLRKNGLPGPISRLFRYSGYQVTEPHYVLYASVATIRLSYLIAAVELAFFTLVALIAAMFQRRHLRRLIQDQTQ